jgi:transposase
MNPKRRVIKRFGYLEDQTDQELFMAEVKKFDESLKKDNLPPDNGLPLKSDSSKKRVESQNFGYKYLEAIYNLLEIDSFINRFLKNKKFRGEYDVASIFKYLVISRILSPDSKRATFQKKKVYYGLEPFCELEDVYRALDNFSDFFQELQIHLNEKIKKIIGRDMTHIFYDVTNYFFEIDFPFGEADLRQKGVSKEHRHDPIAGMGLFLDSNGLPVSMSIFAGNTSESVTLNPEMTLIKNYYGLQRLVVVADKALNSSTNINKLVNAGEGFVFSQVLRGKKGQRYNDELFSKEGWTVNKDNTYRSKTFVENYTGKDSDGKKVIRQRKVFLSWSKADEIRAIKKRNEKLERAKAAINNNVYSIKKGAAEYTQEKLLDKHTGEVIDDKKLKKVRTLNTEKAKDDARYDGYYSIITSELDYDSNKIKEVYGGLWQIEQTFRILKTELSARPVYVRTPEHIRAHFLTCFVGILLIRIMQYLMGDNPLSARRIKRALNSETCLEIPGGMIILEKANSVIAFEEILDKNDNLVPSMKSSDEDEINLDNNLIRQSFGIEDFPSFYLKQEKFNKMLKEIKLPSKIEPIVTIK